MYLHIEYTCFTIELNIRRHDRINCACSI